ncbi:MAG TPA: hypothetical protein H9803_03685 [Candidatus Ligilactobacillus excrementavium]|nr:hypothetical protein [Candidatus Ligilactobacillus excrementavium]
MQNQNNEISGSLLSQEELQMFCDYFSIPLHVLLNDQAALDYVVQKRSNMRALVTGYCEMADLNKEICHEFLSCERDLSSF